ncbi:DUF1801 domain-containing protein [Hymenobacter sp. B81]|uniref:DUF1801 domain-containing protein n=1 Tax=Hymenobacter sp. B81 TaxID=3344878 RepID=UPI0037DD82B6
MNPQVTDYIDHAAAEQRAILQRLRQLIWQAVPATQEQFKWGRPVFAAGSDFAYLKTAKSYITLGFFDATRLPDAAPLLEGTGPAMRHLKLRQLADVDEQQLTRWFQLLTR